MLKCIIIFQNSINVGDNISIFFLPPKKLKYLVLDIFNNVVSILFMNNKISAITKALHGKATYMPIPDNLVDIVYDLYIREIIHDTQSFIDISGGDVVLLYYGLYFEIFKKYYDIAIHCYRMAIDRGKNVVAMYNLAKYFEINYDDKNVEHYYLMAINQGCTNYICQLGKYYTNRKQYSEGIKFLEMGIDKGDID